MSKNISFSHFFTSKAYTAYCSPDTKGCLQFAIVASVVASSQHNLISLGLGIDDLSTGVLLHKVSTALCGMIVYVCSLLLTLCISVWFIMYIGNHIIILYSICMNIYSMLYVYDIYKNLHTYLHMYICIHVYAYIQVPMYTHLHICTVCGFLFGYMYTRYSMYCMYMCRIFYACKSLFYVWLGYFPYK